MITFFAPPVGFSSSIVDTMEGDTYGFLAVEDEHASNSSLGDAVPTCALDASDECMKSPDGGTVAWLDEFRDESCRAVQYSNTSAIPRVS